MLKCYMTSSITHTNSNFSENYKSYNYNFHSFLFLLDKINMKHFIEERFTNHDKYN